MRRRYPLFWLLFAGAPGVVIGGDVSGGWLFGRCPAAWRGGGAGYARPGAAGRLLSARQVAAGRPRRVPPRRRWVKNHPPRPGCVGLRLAAVVSLPSHVAWCPGSVRDRCQDPWQACAGLVALALMRALHSWSGAEGPPLRDDLHQPVVGEAAHRFGDGGAAGAVVLREGGDGGQGVAAGPFARVGPAPQVGFDPAGRQFARSRWHMVIFPNAGWPAQTVYSH
jgi:hypothetical protein